MARRNKAASIVAVVAVLAAWLGAGREARAVITVGSITVGGGVVQNGDPAYTYQIEVLLTGTITPGYTTSFTFGPLVGVNSNSPTSVLMEYMAPGVSWSTPPTITSDYTRLRIHQTRPIRPFRITNPSSRGITPGAVRSQVLTGAQCPSCWESSR